MRQYLQLVALFLQVGLLGYAEPWGVLYGLTDNVSSFAPNPSEMLDFLGLNTILPGGFLLNYTAFLGFSTVGLTGAVVALLAVSLPAFAFAGLAFYMQQYPRCAVIVKDATHFLRLTAFGLFLAALVSFVQSLKLSLLGYTSWHLGIMAFLALSAFLGTALFRLRPWVMMLLCGIAGVLLF